MKKKVNKKTADNTAPKERVVGRPFKPGQSGNPAGRPKGARCKFGEQFVKDFMDDWGEHGKDAIASVREKSPEGYLRAACAILPKLIEFDDETRDALVGAAGYIPFDKIRQKADETK